MFIIGELGIDEVDIQDKVFKALSEADLCKFVINEFTRGSLAATILVLVFVILMLILLKQFAALSPEFVGESNIFSSPEVPSSASCLIATPFVSSMGLFNEFEEAGEVGADEVDCSLLFLT